MRKVLPVIAAGLALATGAAAGATTPDPEAQLARALAGRVAGPPVDCVDLHAVHSTQIIPHTAIVYDSGSVIYVNRPRSGGDQLNRWDTMVTRLNSTQLCSVDTVRMVDPNSRFMTGIVFLGEFVPYRRAN
jgi:hypothetical protein